MNTQTNAPSDERLAEMVGAGMPCVPIMPGEVAHVVQELRERRALNPLSRKQVGGVTVKPLEWVKHLRADMWRAETILGIYEVSAMAGAWWKFVGHDPVEGEDRAKSVANVLDGKSFAQADYERRILSALATDPEDKGKKCAICGADHDNDLLSDICTDCETSAPWREGFVSHETPPAGEKNDIDQAWQELCEKDDRTSPEEYPDMCLISRDELADFLARSDPHSAQPEAEWLKVVAWYDAKTGIARDSKPEVSYLTNYIPLTDHAAASRLIAEKMAEVEHHKTAHFTSTARTVELLKEHDEFRLRTDAAEARTATFERERDALLDAINWSLGCGDDFPNRADGQGAYWWRAELADRAGLTYEKIAGRYALSQNGEGK